jgi:DNA-binding NtrC family response regulator
MTGLKDQTNNRKYILAVDDYPDIVRLIEQALNRQGLKASAFTDAYMALEDFKVNCKDCTVILSDIRMPGRMVMNL